ncbi:hypothetical protein POSPLADRAFT_1039791 [Postia placenta MAD-698-R-SB12]|uniref:Uncharacterized protein n=1 Tax=Postia placenta MAD-698-R-SB12 TaxID=670580 RepID=A0A1X6N2Q8_9APHY|nr:hypothetical protein POSPLADRAFT_1039791 [Postia placenta MAD-698-R-SB12]OSX62917.1 hypothetical protein POSPLADRAFT_1039791 [Postia placenta MAD-698-R-SB12]
MTIPHIPNRLGTQLAFRASDHKASSMYCDVQELATEEPLVVRPRAYPDDDILMPRCLDGSASTYRGVARSEPVRESSLY